VTKGDYKKRKELNKDFNEACQFCLNTNTHMTVLLICERSIRGLKCYYVVKTKGPEYYESLEKHNILTILRREDM
jgi:hypothetical protein